MIVLFTDFGLGGPYVGQMKAVLYRKAPGVPVVELFADLPVFNPRATAYLLPAYIGEFPPGTVFLCVVDPGVGSSRKPVIVYADEHWFVGPDNGVFHVICKRALKRRRWEINYRPRALSSSFHGRDLFAPVAARLAVGREVPTELLDAYDAPWDSWPDDLFEIVYLDHYGNAMTGIRACQLRLSDQLILKEKKLRFYRIFSEAQTGEPFWYENANGLVEIAVKEGSVSKQLQLEVGDRIDRQR